MSPKSPIDPNLIMQRLLGSPQKGEAIWHNSQRLGLKLMEAESFSALLDELLHNTVAHFDILASSLFLLDEQYSLLELVDILHIENYGNRFQIRHSDTFAKALYSMPYDVSTQSLNTLSAARLFPGAQVAIDCVLLLPLMRRDKLIGSLQLAIHEKDQPDMEKYMEALQYFASVVSICLEDNINREFLRLQSRTDMLTQVHNRVCFSEELPLILERALRNQQTVSCCFIDIDYFKTINDVHGHQMGDLCLRDVARTLYDQLRKTDFLARYGGEEFVALLPGCTQLDAQPIAERIRFAVECLSITTTQDNVILPTVSIGLSAWEPPSIADIGIDAIAETINMASYQLIEQADNAMYRAKDQGRNCIINFSH